MTTFLGGHFYFLYSVILSSKILKKDKELQKELVKVVDEFLESRDKLTLESLVTLNKNIRVEEKDENKQILDFYCNRKFTQVILLLL